MLYSVLSVVLAAALCYGGVTWLHLPWFWAAASGPSLVGAALIGRWYWRWRERLVAEMEAVLARDDPAAVVKWWVPRFRNAPLRSVIVAPPQVADPAHMALSLGVVLLVVPLTIAVVVASGLPSTLAAQPPPAEPDKMDPYANAAMLLTLSTLLLVAFGGLWAGHIVDRPIVALCRRMWEIVEQQRKREEKERRRRTQEENERRKQAEAAERERRKQEEQRRRREREEAERQKLAAAAERRREQTEARQRSLDEASRVQAERREVEQRAKGLREELDAALAALSQALAANPENVQPVRDEIERLRGELAAAEKKRDQLQETEARHRAEAERLREQIEGPKPRPPSREPTRGAGTPEPGATAEELIARLESPDAAVRIECLRQLGSTAAKLLDEAQRAMAGEGGRRGPRAALALLAMDRVANQVWPAIAQRFQDAEPAVRQAAAQAAGEAEADNTWPGLIELLHDPHAVVREAAARALGKVCGHTRAFAYAEEQVRRGLAPREMLTAMSRATEKAHGAVVPALAKVVEDRAEDPRVRRAAAEALKAIGTPEARAAASRWRPDDAAPARPEPKSTTAASEAARGYAEQILRCLLGGSPEREQRAEVLRLLDQVHETGRGKAVAETCKEVVVVLEVSGERKTQQFFFDCCRKWAQADPAQRLHILGLQSQDSPSTRQPSTSAPRPKPGTVCYLCSRETLTTSAFQEACREAGLVVDPETGEVKARMGGFSMVGGALDVSDRLQGQREEQQAALRRIEDQRGFRCTKCGRVYCMECLLRHAPDRRGGGKACPGCGGPFEPLD